MSGRDERAALESELLRERIRLYLYGELGAAESREVERCRDKDPEFRALFQDEQAFLQSLGGRDPGADLDPLLEDCRADLDRAIAAEPPRNAPRR